MINQYFKQQSPFIYNYFSALLELVKNNERTFPQGIIFEGIDTKLQYLFSLELARILNCKETKETDCTCTNCRWIKNYEHPAVNIVSQIHFKPESDKSTTVISVAQAKEIESSLKFSSNYHRFFIFFSSKKTNYDAFDLNLFSNLGYSTEIDYSLEPLKYKTFNNASLNSLLKSVEEPPKNTTFIFLTKSRENILPTIVSRCQVFKLSSSFEKTNYNEILSLVSQYPNIKSTISFDMAQNILSYSKENNKDVVEILNLFILYLKDLMITNPQMYSKILNDINIVNHAIKMINSKVDEKIALDTMFLKIARGY